MRRVLFVCSGGGGADRGGTIFKITTAGALTTLYNFCSLTDCADGESPYTGPVQATNGNFYGTTLSGGAYKSGTVYEVTQGGTQTTLYSFCAKFECADGTAPSGLVQGTNGAFYGTTPNSGDNNGYNESGTVFKITASGKLTTLHVFCTDAPTCTDGYQPQAGLVQGTNGDFYGTTSAGGAHGGGTVFKITPGGTLATLYNFCSVGGTECEDGMEPYAPLIQGTDGNFYGTTLAGGNGNGTVFKITPAGILTTLYLFCSVNTDGVCTDGESPYAGLVLGSDGNFYGTTRYGGAHKSGTVFRFTPNVGLATLYSFCSEGGSLCTDGQYPNAGLVQATNGSFYGATDLGGAYGVGTIFSLSVGLGPFVETQPTSGKAGAAVTILGTDLMGATSVTFDGAEAALETVSSSAITTTVPAGAHSGKVRVVTPGGTLSSNLPFRVKP